MTIKKPETQKKKAIIIGGGLAGLTLATEMVDRDLEVLLLEKNTYLGGRASNIIDRTTDDPVPIGPHIFVKGYNNFKKFLDKIGVKNAIVWERNLFFELLYKGGRYQFRMTDIPTSLRTLPRMLRYPFLSFRDKLTNIRVGLKIYFSNPKNFEELDNVNASDFLKQQGVSENSINRMWRFFVLSMLNVPIELCSAAELCLLAQHWAKINRREIGFAKRGLGDIYTTKAIEYIKHKNGVVRTNTQIQEVVIKNGIVEYITAIINDKEERLVADVYISALTPIQLREILPTEVRSMDFWRNLNVFEGVPYISVNLWFDKKISKKKFWALLNDSDVPKYMNLDFYDQSNIYETRKDTSYITSNIIYSKAFESLTDKEIVEATLSEIKTAFPHMDAKLTHSHVHRVPYVIYAPYPGMRKHKLDHKTPISNLYLCGDWTSKTMTQCMESAVESAYRCFDVIQENLD